jgi:hypothetical protein
MLLCTEIIFKYLNNLDIYFHTTHIIYERLYIASLKIMNVLYVNNKLLITN